MNSPQAAIHSMQTIGQKILNEYKNEITEEDQLVIDRLHDELFKLLVEIDKRRCR
jgi:hypothetical protein